MVPDCVVLCPSCGELRLKFFYSVSEGLLSLSVVGSQHFLVCLELVQCFAQLHLGLFADFLDLAVQLCDVLLSAGKLRLQLLLLVLRSVQLFSELLGLFLRFLWFWLLLLLVQTHSLPQLVHLDFEAPLYFALLGQLPFELTIQLVLLRLESLHLTSHVDELFLHQFGVAVLTLQYLVWLWWLRWPNRSDHG